MNNRIHKVIFENSKLVLTVDVLLALRQGLRPSDILAFVMCLDTDRTEALGDRLLTDAGRRVDWSGVLRRGEVPSLTGIAPGWLREDLVIRMQQGQMPSLVDAVIRSNKVPTAVIQGGKMLIYSLPLPQVT